MTVLLHRYRTISDQALARWIPLKASQEWLTEVSGATTFQWDLNAIEVGFLKPLQLFAKSRPSRMRPTLTAAIIEAGGLDPANYTSLLAAIELQFLASMMVRQFYNGKNLTEATPYDAPMSLPILATAAYTARQFAPVLACRHTPQLPADERAWLAYRFGRTLVLGAMGTAIHYAQWHQGKRFMDARASVEHLRRYVCPLTFQLSVDCAGAVLGIRGRPEFEIMQAAAVSLGLVQQLALATNGQSGDESSSAAREPSYFEVAQASTGTASGGKTKDLTFQPHLQTERAGLERTLERMSPPFREILTVFVADFIDCDVRQMEEGNAQ